MRTSAQTLPSAPRRRLENTRARLSPGLPAGSPSVHLDALRGFAAFSVLLNHWRDAFFIDYSKLPHHNILLGVAYLAAGLGHQWVIVFFVMSGYLVGGSVLRSVSSGRWSWRAYLLARMTRLYIVLLPALILGGVIDWIGMHLPGTNLVYSGHSGMHALTTNVHSTLTLPVLVGNDLFLQTTALFLRLGHPIPTFGSNGPLWSLCNEFWYYIAFPILVLLLSRGRSWRMRAVCIVSLLLWGWLLGSYIVLLGIPWLMGVLVGLLPPVPVRRKLARMSLIAASLVLLAVGLVLDKKMDNLPGDLILGSIVTLLVWITLHCTSEPLPSAYIRIARRAAHSSYTLYLVHLPMLILLKASLHLPRAVPGLHMLLIGVAVMAVILVYAQCVYQLFEKNTDRVRKWLKPYMQVRAVV